MDKSLQEAFLNASPYVATLIVLALGILNARGIIDGWRAYVAERAEEAKRHDEAQVKAMTILSEALHTADGMVSQLNTMNYSKTAAEATARNALAQLEAMTGEIAKRDEQIASLKTKVAKVEQDNADLRKRIDVLEKKPVRKGKKNEENKTPIVGGGARIPGD